MQLQQEQKHLKAAVTIKLKHILIYILNPTSRAGTEVLETMVEK